MGAIWSNVTSVITVILFANIILAGFVVFFERRNPSSTWAWLLVLVFIPVFGFLVYLVFGKDGKQERMFREKSIRDQEIYYKYLFHDVHSAEKIRQQKEWILHRRSLADADYLNDMVQLHLNSGNWVTFNNEIDYFNNGEDKFDALIADIRRAKKFIHLEYYIWAGGWWRS